MYTFIMFSEFKNNFPSNMYVLSIPYSLQKYVECSYHAKTINIVIQGSQLANEPGRQLSTQYFRIYFLNPAQNFLFEICF